MRPETPARVDVEAFLAFRPKLFGIAYRMLQVRADAEDAVQEAWIRLSRAKGVDSVEGFLTTTVTRLCIDQLKSARVQRERYVGPWLPEPLPTAAGDRGDPEDAEERVEQAEMLSIALLQVIDRLNPVERAVFLLREAFSYPYDEIASIVGRREDHCRQIARRAPERVRADRPRVEADSDTHARLLDGFLSAATEGDLVTLESLLTEDVVLYSDGGGKAVAATRPIEGPDRVARFMAGVSARGRGRVRVGHALLNGYPAAIVRAGNDPVVTISLDIVDGRIRRVFLVRNPDKLRGLA